MLFDPSNPFPLVEALDYAASRAHARAADQHFGLQVSEVESRISREAYATHEIWYGLDVEALQTPYLELRAMLERLALAPRSRLIDLGAGYGRLGLVAGLVYEQLEFVGYECVRERVEAGRIALERAGLADRCRLVAADLAARDFVPERGDAYFLYDFGHRTAIEKSLEDLRALAREQPIIVVGRGRRARDLIERREPWLASVRAPEHHAHYSIYRSG